MSLSDQEHRRLGALNSLNILDTEPEPIFDSIVELAKLTFNVPVAMISLVDADRLWFKAKIGLSVDHLARHEGFCDHAIRGDGALIVPDARSDPRFQNTPLVAGAPGLRFYAGAPVTLSDGCRIGTLCILDVDPRDGMLPTEIAKLETLARTVVNALELRSKAEQSSSLANEVLERQGLLGLAEKMAGMGTWSWDPASNRTTWSAETYRIHGFDPAFPPPDLEGVLACYHPDDAPKLAACVQRAVQEGVGYDIQMSIVRPSGEIRQIISSAGCRLDAEGRLATLYGSFQDITDLRLMDQALKDSEANYRMLAENIADVVFKVNMDGIIEYTSPSIMQLTGFGPETWNGKHISERIVVDEDIKTLEYIEQNRPLPGGRENEFRYSRADGTTGWAQGNPTVLQDADGNPIGLMSVVRDVTERRAIEDELRRKTAEAEAAVVAKSEFLANMSHEIRTPLTAILGFAGLLDRVDGMPAYAKSYVDRIVSGGQTLLSVVNDILDFSRLDAEGLELAPHPVDPSALVVDVLELVSAEAARKGLDLRQALSPELPAAISIDGPRARQVLLNLVANAVKFTATGSVTVSARYLSEDGGRLHVEVCDTGVGIPADRLDRLFKRFSQIDGSNTRQYGGAGLGLAISKRLIELMAGEIGVTSREGEGSTFWFTIPAPATELRPAGIVTQVEDFGETALRILVVDDVAINRELVKTMLSPFGLELTEAANGVEAVSAAIAETFDLILMDLQMPEMDGLSATRAIRRTSGINGQTPIVAISANVLPQHLLECFEAGMNDHIAKPISPTELLTKISLWTTSNDADDAATTETAFAPPAVRGSLRQ